MDHLLAIFAEDLALLLVELFKP